METVFGPIGDSDVLGLTASSQAFALGTMATANPAIRLIALNPSHLAWYLKFGTSGAVTVSRTDGMRLVPGSKEKPVVIPVPSGSTHVAILCEGASGNILASYGGFDNGEFSPAGASQIVAVTTTDQRVALPALAAAQPAIRLVSMASNIQSLWIKLGDVTVTGDMTSSMKIAPGSVEAPTIIPVTDGETHLSIFCEGVGGDVVLTPGGVVAVSSSVPTTSVMFSAGPRILARASGAGPGQELTLSQVLDFIGSAAQGDILFRGASAWQRLAAGPGGNFLQTLGVGFDPQWATPPGSNIVSVTDFGAVADNDGTAGNGTDNLTAFQDALDFVKPIGAQLHIPRGRYRISGALGLDYTTGADFTTRRASICGDGARASSLVFDDGDYVGLTLAGPTTPWPNGQTFRGFGLIKEDGQGEGLLLARMAHIHVEDVEVVAWETGLVGIDVQESLFSNFTAYFNLYGGYFERSSVTQPNVLTFVCCTFGNSQNQGLDIVDPGQLCFYGGSIESNGELGSDPDKFGLRLRWETTVAEANIGCNLNGVYFERNAGVGDIHLINDQVPMAWNINGCNFNRGEVGTGTGLYGTSCITITGGSSAQNTLALMGCGFGGLPRSGGGAYPPSAARPYITITTATEPLTIADIGNQYADAVETPGWASNGGVSVVQTASGAVGQVLYSNNADAAGGPAIRLVRDSASPAANDYGGAILAEFKDSAGNLFVGCEIDAKLLDPTNGSEDTALELYTTVAGAQVLAAGLANGLTVGTATYDGTGSIRAAGSIKSQSASGGVGYATGAGGAVTQATSKATAVTIDRPCGQITMNNAALAAGASVTFVVNNNTVATTDCVVVNHDSVGTLGVYDINAHTISAGAFSITVSNYSAGSLSQAIVLNFVVVKAVAA